MRVMQRAQGGGHAASELDIHTVYHASVANLRRAMYAFERVRVYDSTARWTVPRLVAVARAGRVVLQGEAPAWLTATLSARED